MFLGQIEAFGIVHFKQYSLLFNSIMYVIIKSKQEIHNFYEICEVVIIDVSRLIIVNLFPNAWTTFC